MWREKLQDEARAKIFWGDNPESVGAYLQSQGLNPQEATSTIDAILVEREASVRSSGRRAILIGVPLALVPFVSYYFLNQLGVFPIKIFAVTVLVGLAGGWKLVKGTTMLLFPKSHTGDLSDPADTP